MDLTVSFVKESNILGLEGILEIMKALKEPCDLSLKPEHFWEWKEVLLKYMAGQQVKNRIGLKNLIIEHLRSAKF